MTDSDCPGPRAGQLVVSADGIEIGRIITVEPPMRDRSCGIVIKRTDGYGGESRLPGSWMAGITDDGVVLLSVKQKEISL